MSWAYEFEAGALRELQRLDHTAQLRIVRYLDKLIAGAADPRRFGQPLRASRHGLWRWRVENYRLIGRILETRLIIQIVRVGHRKDVYDF